MAGLGKTLANEHAFMFRSSVNVRGIHNESSAVRHRAFYLFHRFIKDIKPALSVDFVPSILESMSVCLHPSVPLSYLDF